MTLKRIVSFFIICSAYTNMQSAQNDYNRGFVKWAHSIRDRSLPYVNQQLRQDLLIALEDAQRAKLAQQELEERLDLVLKKNNYVREKTKVEDQQEELPSYDDFYEVEDSEELLESSDRKSRFSYDGMNKVLEEEESQDRYEIEMLEEQSLDDLYEALQENALETTELMRRKNLEYLEANSRTELQAQQVAELNRVQGNEREKSAVLTREASERRNRVSEAEEKYRELMAAQQQEKLDLESLTRKKKRHQEAERLRLQTDESLARDRIAQVQAKEQVLLAKNQREDHLLIKSQQGNLIEETFLNSIKSKKIDSSIKSLFSKGKISKELLLKKFPRSDHSYLLLLLDCAIKAKDTDFIKTLITEAQSLSININRVLLAAMGKYTLFQSIIAMNDVSLVKFVLDTPSVDVTEVLSSPNSLGFNALFFAVNNQYLAVAKELLKNRPSMDYNTVLCIKSAEDLTVLMAVISNMRLPEDYKVEAVKLLLQEYPGFDTVKLLTEIGADGADALLLAINQSVYEVVKILIESRPGLDLANFIQSARVNNKATPLALARHVAQHATGDKAEKAKDIVKLLLEKIVSFQLR